MRKRGSKATRRVWPTGSEGRLIEGVQCSLSVTSLQMEAPGIWMALELAGCWFDPVRLHQLTAHGGSPGRTGVAHHEAAALSDALARAGERSEQRSPQGREFLLT